MHSSHPPLFSFFLNLMVLFPVCSLYLKVTWHSQAAKWKHVLVSFKWAAKGTSSDVPLWVPNQHQAQQCHTSTQYDHASHGKAASLLALPNTWANSLLPFLEGWSQYQKHRGSPFPAKLTNEMLFPSLFLPLLNKIISVIKVIKVPLLSFLPFQPSFFFFPRKAHTPGICGFGARIIHRENTDAAPAVLRCFSKAKSSLYPF